MEISKFSFHTLIIPKLIPIQPTLREKVGDRETEEGGGRGGSGGEGDMGSLEIFLKGILVIRFFQNVQCGKKNVVCI